MLLALCQIVSRKLKKSFVVKCSEPASITVKTFDEHGNVGATAGWCYVVYLFVFVDYICLFMFCLFLLFVFLVVCVFVLFCFCFWFYFFVL